jgi:hypothetical protein
MKTNELRTGNYYLAFGVDLKQVETLTKDKILIDFTPIQLTEEWLLNFGFYKCVLFDTFLYIRNTNFHISFYNNIYQLNYKESPKSQWIPVCKDLKYIHQLQNLYFVLTGKELKLRK